MGIEDSADNEHHRHHPCCPKEERLAATQLINTNQEEDTSGDDLDGTINTGGEERGIGLGYADRLEDSIVKELASPDCRYT